MGQDRFCPTGSEIACGQLVPRDRGLARAEFLDEYLTRLFLPWRCVGGVLVIACADNSAENRCWLAARYGDVSIFETAPQTLIDLLGESFGAQLTDDAVHGLSRRRPELSAHRVVTARQTLIFVLLACVLAAMFWLYPLAALRVFVGVMSLGFFAGALFRGWLVRMGRSGPAHPLRAARGDETLPLYTILAPLYREANVLPDLADALFALDYPSDRLDVMLVVEADDGETLRAARRAAAEHDFFRVIAVPPGKPRTKPKAANYALRHARGDFIVIYDAEDRPEPDQLRKAVAAFRERPRDVACLQARLNFYNIDCWLTKMFALDYALWFDLLLPGLDRIGVPMPLGGTSNHFRTAILREIGGWDAFNVTEDADIGIRLAQLGYRVSMLDSTTFEEAPARISAWLRQRSRWLKGYMQTWLVHVRNPIRLVRRTGLGGFFAFQLFIGGALVCALVNPLLWAAFIAAAYFHWSLFPAFEGRFFFYVPAAGLASTNMLLTYLAIIGPRRRGWNELSPYGLTVMAYWGLVSLAGYRGLWQLLTRPFFWEKTAHGIGAIARRRL